MDEKFNEKIMNLISRIRFDEDLFNQMYDEYLANRYGTDIIEKEKLEVISQITNKKETLSDIEAIYCHARWVINEYSNDRLPLYIIIKIRLESGDKINMWQAIEIFRFIKHPDKFEFFDDTITNNSPTTFGISIDNPIIVPGIDFSEIYLGGLMGSDRTPVSYKRIKSTKRQEMKNPIDIYQIMNENNKQIAEVYMNCYGRFLSRNTPPGFIWL